MDHLDDKTRQCKQHHSHPQTPLDHPIHNRDVDLHLFSVITVYLIKIAIIEHLDLMCN